MMDMIHAEQKVDIFDFVSRIRNQRPQMVQTDVSNTLLGPSCPSWCELRTANPDAPGCVPSPRDGARRVVPGRENVLSDARRHTVDAIDARYKWPLLWLCPQTPFPLHKEKRRAPLEPTCVSPQMQYTFIYQALLEYYLYGDTELDVASLEKHLQTLHGATTHFDQAGLEEEFRVGADLRATFYAKLLSVASPPPAIDPRKRRGAVLPVTSEGRVLGTFRA